MRRTGNARIDTTREIFSFGSGDGRSGVSSLVTPAALARILEAIEGGIMSDQHIFRDKPSQAEGEDPDHMDEGFVEPVDGHPSQAEGEDDDL